MADYPTDPGGHCLAHGNYPCGECSETAYMRRHTRRSEERVLRLVEAIARKFGVEIPEDEDEF